MNDNINNATFGNGVLEVEYFDDIITVDVNNNTISVYNKTTTGETLSLSEYKQIWFYANPESFYKFPEPNWD